MADEVEPITLVAGNQKHTLSQELSALIWDAVKRGKASSAEELVNRLLEQLFLTKQPTSTKAEG